MRAGPLTVSLALHAVAVIWLLEVHFGPDPSLASPPARTLLLMAPRFPPRMPPPLSQRPIVARISDQRPAASPGVRVFATPSPRSVTRPSIADVELPSAEIDLAINPAVFPIPSDLPVVPAPPLKTDNLAPVAHVAMAPAAGRMEATGFGTAAVAQARFHAPPSTTAGFAAATPEKAAPPDPALPAQAGFGDASVSVTMPVTGRTPNAQAGSETSVEILEKPRPLYTEEARRLHLEGEVVLEALFPASGRPNVLRVLRHLGHGMDQNAAAAVQGIRFRPATRAGQAVDSSAIVHIVFQIAY